MSDKIVYREEGGRDSASCASSSRDEGCGTVSRAISPLEMHDREAQARHHVDARLRAYLDFPTATNFDGVIACMRDFQHAWMNGRKRVLG